MPLCHIQQSLCSHNVSSQKQFRFNDRPIHVALRRKMDHRVKVIRFKKLLHQRPVPNISFCKHIAGVGLYALQVFQVPGIGQQIQIHKQFKIFLALYYISDKI